MCSHRWAHHSTWLGNRLQICCCVFLKLTAEECWVYPLPAIFEKRAPLTSMSHDLSIVLHSCLQLGGAVTQKPLNMGVLLKKRVTLVCSTLRSRSLEYKHRLVQEVSVIKNTLAYFVRAYHLVIIQYTSTSLLAIVYLCLMMGH